MTTKMATKAQAVALKSAPSDEGQFEALVAVFNNIDSYGDVILKGAFADTLLEWKDSGYPIPVVWSHEKDDPFSHIGTVTDAKETDTGLLVTGQLDLDNPKAAQVHRLLKGGRVKEFSFAFSYAMEDVNPAKRDEAEVRELKKLKLYEVGPTLVGANPATQLVGVKSLEKAEDDPVEDPTDTPPADPADDPDDEESDDWAQASEIVSQVSDLLTQLSDIITRNTDSDDSDEDDPEDDDEASRGQTDDDETAEGKSSEDPADRSAEEEQKQLAELFSAILQEDSDETRNTTD